MPKSVWVVLRALHNLTVQKARLMQVLYAVFPNRVSVVIQDRSSLSLNTKTTTLNCQRPIAVIDHRGDDRISRWLNRITTTLPHRPHQPPISSNRKRRVRSIHNISP